MTELKQLVPLLEDCKSAYDAGVIGDDTALVWYRHRGEDRVCPRDQWIGVGGMRPTPAPTLEELLAMLPAAFRWNELRVTKEHVNGIFSVGYDVCMRFEKVIETNSNAAAAALRLLMKVKKS